MMFRTYIVLMMIFFPTTASAQDDPLGVDKTIRLATTTSTYHSGLLSYLLPEFEKQTGYKIKVLAAGTGKALRMGETGDVDLMITHAPKAEADFIEKGFGILPQPLMYNDFILVGPSADPARIRNQEDIHQAFLRIAKSDSGFVSRGDDSGTHKKELSIWDTAGGFNHFPKYSSVGQGMGPTLMIANELQAYTLTDRGTWLAFFGKLDLEIIYEGDKALFNPYQIIVVNPERHPHNNVKGAMTLSHWLISPEAQTLIDRFKINGHSLFIANANEFKEAI